MNTLRSSNLINAKRHTNLLVMRAPAFALLSLCAALLICGPAQANKVCVLKYDPAESYKTASNPCDAAANQNDPAKTLVQFDWCGLSSYKIAVVYQQDSPPVELGGYEAVLTYGSQYFSALACDFNPKSYFDFPIKGDCPYSAPNIVHGAYTNWTHRWTAPFPAGVELFTIDFATFTYDSENPATYPAITFSKNDITDSDANDLLATAMVANIICNAPAYMVKDPTNAAVTATQNADCSGANITINVTPPSKCLDLTQQPAVEANCPSSCSPGVSVYNTSPGATSTIAAKSTSTVIVDPALRDLDTTYQYKIEGLCTGTGIAKRSPLQVFSVTPRCANKFPSISNVTVNGTPAAAVMDQNSILVSPGADIEIRGKITDEDSNVTAETVTLAYGGDDAPAFPQYATASPSADGVFTLTIPGAAVQANNNLYWALWATDTVLTRAARFPSAYAGTRTTAAYIDYHAIQVATPPPFIVINQLGDDQWRGSDPGAIYDVDFASYISKVDSAQYTAWSGPDMAGSELIPWTNIATAINSHRYTSGWPVAFASLTEGMNYISVRAYDDEGTVSQTATDAFHIKKDTTPPDPVATVNDGPAADIFYATAPSQLSANWPAASDPQSGVAAYWYAIGSSTGSADIATWTSAASATSMTKTALALTEGLTYYISVKAQNGAGLFSTPIVSNGQNYNPPPADVTAFSAIPGDNTIYLSWTNPSAPDFAATRVMRSTSAYPQSATEGTLLYDGSATGVVDAGATNGLTYYYTAFAYDGIQNFAPGTSPGARASALPAESGIYINQGWNLVGVSIQNTPLIPALMFSFATGTYEIYSATGTPVLLTNYTNIQMEFTGAYWIYSKTELGRKIVTGPELNAQSYDINLASGWNAFSLPFDKAIPWDAAHASLKCGGDTPAISAVYTYANNAYTVTAPGAGYLSPWTAYWIRVPSACTLKISK